METKDRFTEIDGLRGLAAMLVLVTHWGEEMLRHAQQGMVHTILDSLFLQYFSPGRMGVVAFFCISGFVIPFSFRGKYPLISFPIGRFFRIYPAFWFALSVSAVLALVYTNAGMPAVTPTQFLWNMTMLHRLIGVNYIVAVDWTLLIEWAFYVLCYILFAARLLGSARVNIMMIFFLLTIGVIGGMYRWGHPASSLSVGIPTYLAAMHFGALTRMERTGTGGISPRLYRVGLFCLILGVFATNTLAYYHTKTEIIGVTAANTGYFGGVALFMLCAFRKWFKSPVFLFLGAISYSLYLLHVIVLIALRPVLESFNSLSVAFIVLTPTYIVIVLVVATLSQRLIEMPSVSLGRRIDEAIEQWIVSRMRQPART